MPLLITSVCVFLMDQLTKRLILSHFSTGMSVAVIRNVFHLTLVENTGIAFGFFQRHPNLLFLVITLSVITLGVLAFSFGKKNVWKQIAFGLILGGAIGNWLDRFRFGHVVDFLDFRIWPVFNVADASITIGVALFLLMSLTWKKTHAS